MSKIIAVVGATGTQGGSVVARFSKIPGWQTRAITRNPDSHAARKLASQGVEIVQADLDDVESLKSAFCGASAIFGVTDFWQFVQKESTQKLAQAKGISWNEACYLQEVQQGKNIIDAAAHVAQHGPLERMVLSTLSDARRASAGKYTWVYHFDSKAHFVEYLKDRALHEATYQALYDKTSYVQIGNYLDNWKKNPILAPKRGDDGVVVFRSISPDASEGESLHRTPFVHPPTDTGLFVEALVLKAAPQTTLLGTCALMSLSEYVKLWGDINGVKTKIQILTADEVDLTWPGGFGLEVGQTACYVREFGWDGGEGAILPEQAGVNVGELTDIKSYIETTDWSSILD